MSRFAGSRSFLTAYEPKMNTHFTLTAFVADSDSEEQASPLDLEHLETLLTTLIAAERPRSFRVLFWLLLRTFRKKPELHAAIIEEWLPSEADLAQLLEDAGKDGARTALSLEGVRGELERLWQLCDDAGLASLVKTTDPWEAAALAPMAALYTEEQLDQLIAAAARGQQWRDPAEILSPDGEGELDLEALIGLAQSRMVKAKGGEALNIVVLRLMSCADKVN